MFSCNRDKPVAATLQRKCFGGIIFVIITKIITKIVVPRNSFVIISARVFTCLFRKYHWGQQLLTYLTFIPGELFEVIFRVLSVCERESLEGGK